MEHKSKGTLFFLFKYMYTCYTSTDTHIAYYHAVCVFEIGSYMCVSVVDSVQTVEFILIKNLKAGYNC